MNVKEREEGGDGGSKMGIGLREGKWEMWARLLAGSCFLLSREMLAQQFITLRC